MASLKVLLLCGALLFALGGPAQAQIGPTTSYNTALPNGTTAATQTAGDTSTKVATDAFVANAVTAGVPSAGVVHSNGAALGTETIDPTLTEASGTLKCTTATSGQLGCVKPDGTTITNSSGAVSVTYGTTANTAAQGNDSRITGAAPLASPGLTGTPTAPTPATGDNSTSIATTAFVQAERGVPTLTTSTNTSILLPTGWKVIKYKAIGGGGGSGCGYVVTSGTAISGGGTGGTATRVDGEILSSISGGTSLSITIGAAGTSCTASGTTSGSSGSSPSAGGNTIIAVGSITRTAYGAGAGSNGQSAANSGGGGASSPCGVGNNASGSTAGGTAGCGGVAGGSGVAGTGGSNPWWGSGGTGGPNGAAGVNGNAGSGGGVGGSGAGLAASPAALAGGAGARCSMISTAAAPGGLATCTGTSQNGAAGLSPVGTGADLCGFGGGGGASCTASAGGNGGSASGFGASGGGGGSTLAGYLAGSGGAASAGAVFWEVY